MMFKKVSIQSIADRYSTDNEPCIHQIGLGNTIKESDVPRREVTTQFSLILFKGKVTYLSSSQNTLK